MEKIKYFNKLHMFNWFSFAVVNWSQFVIKFKYFNLRKKFEIGSNYEYSKFKSSVRKLQKRKVNFTFETIFQFAFVYAFLCRQLSCYFNDKKNYFRHGLMHALTSYQDIIKIIELKFSFNFCDLSCKVICFTIFVFI